MTVRGPMWTLLSSSSPAWCLQGLGRACKGGTQPTGDICLEDKSASLHTPGHQSKLVTSLIKEELFSCVVTPGKRWAGRGGRSRAGLLKGRARKSEKSKRRSSSGSWQGGTKPLGFPGSLQTKGGCARANTTEAGAVSGGCDLPTREWPNQVIVALTIWYPQNTRDWGTWRHR